MNRNQHLFGEGRKYILALDGGGTRGIVSLAFLEEIERQLAAVYGTGQDFRLCDHFALIGGTSTGSIIATGLALGYRVTELIDLYQALSKDTFASPRWFGGILQSKFASRPLMDAIQSEIGDKTLGDDALRCGLAIIAKRLDSHSVWVFHNHPDGRYFKKQLSGELNFTANADLPLARLIRASTAAPTYFDPEIMEIAPGLSGAFVDGGMSPHNNPSLALFMLATMSGYGFKWKQGINNLHILSIGTGTVVERLEDRQVEDSSAAGVAMSAVMSLMSDCDRLVETLMQWMGRAQNPQVIDDEIGDLSADFLSDVPLFEYVRHNIRIDREWIHGELGIDLDDQVVGDLGRIDNPVAIDRLLELSRVAARKSVQRNSLLIAPS